MITTLPVIHCELGEWGLDHKVPSTPKCDRLIPIDSNIWIITTLLVHSLHRLHFFYIAFNIMLNWSILMWHFSAHGSALILTIFLTKSNQNEAFWSVRFFFIFSWHRLNPTLRTIQLLGWVFIPPMTKLIAWYII